LEVNESHVWEKIKEVIIKSSYENGVDILDN